jgi:hypothetical protein
MSAGLEEMVVVRCGALRFARVQDFEGEVRGEGLLDDEGEVRDGGSCVRREGIACTRWNGA